MSDQTNDVSSAKPESGNNENAEKRTAKNGPNHESQEIGDFHQNERRGRPRKREQMPQRSSGDRRNYHHQRTNQFKEGDEGFFRANRCDAMSYDKLAEMEGPTINLPPLNLEERKFSGRNKLFIGNLAPDVTEQDLIDLFGKYGELENNSVYHNKERSFAFVKYDFYKNAEKAKHELDSYELKGRYLKIKAAQSNAFVKVKNLPPFVSNELLYLAFSAFGDVEKATVWVDERGKSLGEGVVEYTRKLYAQNAIRVCSEQCFLLTQAIQPCIVEPYEPPNWDGFPEKSFPRESGAYLQARSVGPRIANPQSFDHEYSTRWKDLINLYTQKEEALKMELKMEVSKLEARMEFARFEHETEMLREELKAREMAKERHKKDLEMRERESQLFKRRHQEVDYRAPHGSSRRGGENRRRNDENDLFQQAHQLTEMLNQQELNFEGTDNRNTSAVFIPPPLLSQEYNHQDNEQNMEIWVTNPAPNDFPNKKKRF